MIIFLISKNIFGRKNDWKNVRKGSETLENEGFGRVCPPQAPKKSVFWGISEEKLTSIPPLLLTDLKQGGEYWLKFQLMVL